MWHNLNLNSIPTGKQLYKIPFCTSSASFHWEAVVPTQRLFLPLRWFCRVDPGGCLVGTPLFLPAPPGCEAPPNLTKKQWGLLEGKKNYNRSRKTRNECILLNLRHVKGIFKITDFLHWLPTSFFDSFVLQDVLHIADPVFVRFCTLRHWCPHGKQLIQCKLVTAGTHDNNSPTLCK